MISSDVIAFNASLYQNVDNWVVRHCYKHKPYKTFPYKGTWISLCLQGRWIDYSTDNILFIVSGLFQMMIFLYWFLLLPNPVAYLFTDLQSTFRGGGGVGKGVTNISFLILTNNNYASLCHWPLQWLGHVWLLIAFYIVYAILVCNFHGFLLCFDCSTRSSSDKETILVLLRDEMSFVA